MSHPFVILNSRGPEKESAGDDSASTPGGKKKTLMEKCDSLSEAVLSADTVCDSRRQQQDCRRRSKTDPGFKGKHLWPGKQENQEGETSRRAHRSQQVW